MSRIIALVIGAAALTLAVFFLGGRNVFPPTVPPGVEAMAAPALFARTCAQCHGASGEGVTNLAPPLRGLNLTAEIIKQRIQKGGQKMPPLPFIKGKALDRLAGYVAGLR